MKNRYYILLLLATLLCWGCTVDVIDRGGDDGDDDTQNDEVTVWMDGVLSEKYLYNDEYNELEKDLTISYDNFLASTLKQMTTNVLDYKDGSLYTGIYRTATTKSVTRISQTKVEELTLGLARAATVSYDDDTQMGVLVMAVIKDSPLYDAGVRRGDVIWSVNSAKLTSENISGYAQILLEPTSATTYTLSFEDGSSAAPVAKYMYCSPILHSDIYDGSVGYISYLNFDMAWDDELMAELTDMKSQGITDLILDMRLNTGGYVSTANKLSTAIAGDAAMGEVFANYRYNDTRMATMSTSDLVENFNISATIPHLNFTTLYCLVSDYTASASELVINSLRGIDIEVFLIGTQTEGKNVAMEVQEKTFGDYDYQFYPISIELSNAKGYSGYEDGFEEDIYVDDWNGGANFADFGEDEIMIKTARELISSQPLSTSVVSQSRGGGVVRTIGEVLTPSRRVDGNILLVEE
ncbi:MAG: S41 family peptidase [Rikenellaceae bacterium]